MEVGAVKQAFNNEVILLKKSLNQARIQVIHKLTRKAKVFLAKKAPEKLQAKLKRKAETAVNEVLIMKKIKPKDLAKFIVTHKDDLNKYLNKPTVDLEKACARLSLHKALQDKYKTMRASYFNIPIDDLFMSRLERQKIKKEKRELMNKNNNKNTTNRNKKNSISSDGDWSVEDVKNSVNSHKITDDMSVKDSQIADAIDDESLSENDELPRLGKVQESDSEDLDEDIVADNKPISKKQDAISSNSDLSAKLDVKEAKSPKNCNEVSKNISNDIKPHIKQELKEDKRLKLPKMNKNKNKKSDEGFHTKKVIKEKEESIVFDNNKMVDPFFKTVTGESYMSLVEPRAPDEVKDIHYQGNRQMRRAVMFGHAPRMKPRQNFRQDNPNYNRFNKDEKAGNSRFNKDDNKGNNKFSNNKFDKSFKGDNYNGSDDNRLKKRTELPKEVTKEEKPEKLHPSWEAKKKISNILPFKGKKTTFNED